jgi:DNA replication protein
MSSPGFPEDFPSQIPIPEQFFRQVLFKIKNLQELKFTLYIFWRLNRMEGPVHYLLFSDLLEDSQLFRSLGRDSDSAPKAIDKILRQAISHGALLSAELKLDNGVDTIICLNSPKGRAMVDAIQRGIFKLIDSADQPINLYAEHPNIFQLYEANIGPLTPLIADALRDAENTYQADWIEEAFRIAVERNKRNWNYIEAILHHWQEGGRDDRKSKQNRRDTEEAIRKYGEWEK